MFLSLKFEGSNFSKKQVNIFSVFLRSKLLFNCQLAMFKKWNMIGIEEPTQA